MKKGLCIIFALILALLPLFNFNEQKIFAEQKSITDYTTSDYSNFNIISSAEFYCSKNYQIEHFKNGEVETFGTSGNLDGQLTNIIFFKVLKNGEFAVFDSLNRLQFFDISFNHLKTILYIKNNNNYSLVGNITEIQTDIFSNVYLLDSTNSCILKANSSLSNFEIYKTLSNITNASQFTVTNTTNEIILLNDNVLSTSTQDITLTQNAKNVLVDSQNNIIVVYQNKIEKYNSNLTLQKEVLAEFGSNYNLRLDSGIIYYILNNEIIKLEDFADNAYSFVEPVNPYELTTLNSQVEVYEIKTSCNLLVNPYSSESQYQFSINDKVIKLGETENFQTKFYYVMFISDSHKLVGYLEEKYLQLKSFENLNISKTPVREDISYYKYPTKECEQSFKIGNLNFQNNYQVLREIEINNICYYEIALESSYVYVLNYELITADEPYINTILQTNGQINNLYGEKQINLYSSQNKDEIIAKLSSNKQVKIIEDYSNGLSLIEVIIDNNVIKGYVETKYLSKEDYFVTPITIILLFISISLLAIIIIKFKKDQKRRNIKF